MDQAVLLIRLDQLDQLALDFRSDPGALQGQAGQVDQADQAVRQGQADQAVQQGQAYQENQAVP